MTIDSGGSPMFPLVVHHPASPSIWPAVQSPRRSLSTSMLCICVGDVMDVVFSVCIVRRGAVGARVWGV